MARDAFSEQALYAFGAALRVVVRLDRSLFPLLTYARSGTMYGAR